jgi:ubiquinone/menaquinone biosynthesis C-methylase UbiE
VFKRVIGRHLKCPSGFIAPRLLGFIWNRRNAALNDSALVRLQPNRNDRILDVGFGGGYLLAKLVAAAAAGHVSGVDVSTAMVARCRRRLGRWIQAGDLDLQCAPVDSLPYPDGHFTKVASVNSLFFWPDVEQGAREIRRVLKANGLLVLAYTCKQDLEKRGLSCHGVRSFRDDEVTRTLEESGFREVVVERERDKYRDYSVVTARR